MNPLEGLLRYAGLWRAFQLGANNKLPWQAAHADSQVKSENPLMDHFEANKSGRGIWKWRHYFDAYHSHLEKFRGTDVTIVEVGVYSGGSLNMWRNYFGPRSRVYGVDISPECQAYRGEGVEIFTGDQANPAFWRDFRTKVPKFDIVIDDGGHHFAQQVTTLEGTLPYMASGGVYICEDVHYEHNRFPFYIYGLASALNAAGLEHSPENNARRLVSAATQFQAAIASVHLYPFLTVIEKRDSPLMEFVAPKHGTEWQPFLK